MFLVRILSRMPLIINAKNNNNTSECVYRGAWTWNHRWCKRCIPRQSLSCWPEESRPSWGPRRSRPGGPSGWRSWMGLWVEGGHVQSTAVRGERNSTSHINIMWCDFVTLVFHSYPTLSRSPASAGAAAPAQWSSCTRKNGISRLAESWLQQREIMHQMPIICEVVDGCDGIKKK